ncbi:hypothetical protein LuPra_04337 [Luteitalea pratensis]|uniref:Uncharacterized protein n=1 Tax=Luteitalea pratensis TaxID=1855912 RepID=A0A143PR54_LUTPR|nr:hypothetical protein [Luteitalea pratensis]AMY11092.1 hypothetical protein LuPra_04337 [Luteitalea pratensis]
MKDDFEVLEDGERRPVVSSRYLASTSAVTRRDVLPPSLKDARLDEVVTNRALADAPAFVQLLDDLNISSYDSHRNFSVPSAPTWSARYPPGCRRWIAA